MRFLQCFAAMLVALLLPGCVPLTIAWADLNPDGAPATPAALGSFDGAGEVASLAAWERERAPALKAAFADHVYGAPPDGYGLEILGRKVLDEAAFGGAGRLVEYQLQAEVQFGSETRAAKPFYMNVVTPAGVSAGPVILMQTFCPRADTMPHASVRRLEGERPCAGGGALAGIATYVFGRYIATPPIEMILKRGYSIATVYPSEFAPDRREEGLQELQRLAAPLNGDANRWGAIAAWAWGYSLMMDALAADAAFTPAAFIAYGHSRYAKAALLAGANDTRVAAVISHQSGTGGASLNRFKKGESVKSITSSYPHWFAPAYAGYAGREEEMPVDQHQLLALLAPRPVLLGNARRDVWSDPNGAFRAAIGADPVYELYGAKGLEQTRLDDWRPGADIAFWIRPGTHGVVEEDWPAFLEFLDAHFHADS